MKSSDCDKWWVRVSRNSFWYLVGLITSDGCLSLDGRHIDITSKESGYLRTVRKQFGFSNRICRKRNGNGQVSYRIQLSSREFYMRMLEIGLIPNKSKTVGRLYIPKEYFADFMRGLIDGDGSIRRWKHPGNKIEQWSLRICSASKVFIEWIKTNCCEYFGVTGRLYEEVDGKERRRWVLKYGKLAAQRLLSKCYHKESTISLKRKEYLARRCIDTERGWSKSKTLL